MPREGRKKKIDNKELYEGVSENWYFYFQNKEGNYVLTCENEGLLENDFHFHFTRDQWRPDRGGGGGTATPPPSRQRRFSKGAQITEGRQKALQTNIFYFNKLITL